MRILSICLFLLLWATATWAQRPVPFKKYGYPEETVIRGIQGKSSLYIPISREVVVDKSSIHLVLVASEVLNFERSYLTVFLNGVPVRSAYLRPAGDTLKIDIPLEERYVASGFLRIDFKTQLRISDEICEDYSDAGYWVRLTRLSFMNLTIDPNKEALPDNQIEAIVDKLKYIVIPDDPTEADVRNASYVHFFLARTRDKRLKVSYLSQLPDNLLDKALIIAPYDRLRPTMQRKLGLLQDSTAGFIKLYNEPVQNVLTGEEKPTENILLTGESERALEKAVYYFIHPDFLSSSYTDEVQVFTSMPPESYRAVNRYQPIYFENIGVDYELLEGIGSIETEIAFRRSDFGALVERLELHLEGVYRPLDLRENAFLNIYLNEVLLTSVRLDESGKLDFTFNNENFVLRKQNLLKIQFFYVPDEGFCQGKDVNFFAQLDPVRCYLKPVDYVRQPPLTFFWFPENFNEHPTGIYVQDRSGLGTIPAISDVINMINPGDQREGFIYPPVNLYNEVNELQTDSAVNKVIFAHDVDRLTRLYEDDLHIDFSEDTVHYEVRQLRQLLSVRYGHDLGWNQLFESDNEAIMLLHNPTRDTLTMNSLIRSIKEQAMTNSGNVIIAREKESYFFNLSEASQEQVEFETRSVFLSFWDTYGLFVVIILLIFALLLLVYLYQKSLQSKRSIEDER